MVLPLIPVLLLLSGPELEPVLVTSKTDQAMVLLEVLDSNDPAAEAKKKELIVKDGDKFASISRATAGRKTLSARNLRLLRP